LALTGLTLKEYNLLLPEFERAYRQRYESDRTRIEQPRKRKVGGGVVGRLDKIEDKLLFILVYQKTYPLQIVMGKLFALGQSATNQWIHRLLPVLQDGLTTLGFMPERDGQKFATAERKRTEPQDYIIDGTERRRHRPKDSIKQALHYSEKKKLHTDKNIVITHTKTKSVCFLSSTRPGTVHDKKLAEHENISYPRKSVVHKDTAFQGYEPDVRQTYQPKKSRVVKN
jgi:DDE superfamily endonuclease/Helix-turn-helix of DDE superfamily endonuclease